MLTGVSPQGIRHLSMMLRMESVNRIEIRSSLYVKLDDVRPMSVNSTDSGSVLARLRKRSHPVNTFDVQNV